MRSRRVDDPENEARRQQDFHALLEWLCSARAACRRDAHPEVPARRGGNLQPRRQEAADAERRTLDGT